MRAIFIRLVTTCCVLPFLSLTAYAQCEIPAGGLIINEVGNLSDQDTAPASGEFIELLVTGPDSLLPVDVSGLIIDDNHSAFGNVGSIPGTEWFGEIIAPPAMFSATRKT